MQLCPSPFTLDQRARAIRSQNFLSPACSTFRFVLSSSQGPPGHPVADALEDERVARARPHRRVKDQGLDVGEPRHAAFFERLGPLCGTLSPESPVGSRRGTWRPVLWSWRPQNVVGRRSPPRNFPPLPPQPGATRDEEGRRWRLGGPE